MLETLLKIINSMAGFMIVRDRKLAEIEMVISMSRVVQVTWYRVFDEIRRVFLICRCFFFSRNDKVVDGVQIVIVHRIHIITMVHHCLTELEVVKLVIHPKTLASMGKVDSVVAAVDAEQEVLSFVCYDKT